MTRVDLRAWSGLLLAGTILTYVGCSRSTPTASNSGTASLSPKTASAPSNSAPAADASAGEGKSGKLFANWPSAGGGPRGLGREGWLPRAVRLHRRASSAA